MFRRKRTENVVNQKQNIWEIKNTKYLAEQNKRFVKRKIFRDKKQCLNE